ncbi:hypothetical protein PDESU_01983 [Pontiella desulfatans]|uniref:Uncharacterized protein n=1 Tax=Pontiella desulfatans TaxID=2750659 RepID=A0A6C2U219_PONDE|nr:hypothetical protein [Pontiella desulfatans]VGO13426.1 hypothetical protein PDESU_01983 [Pontiella desulfatans]
MTRRGLGRTAIGNAEILRPSGKGGRRALCPPDAGAPAACPRPAANFALPADTGKAWSKARLVDLETEELALDANGAVNLDITKKKIITIEFLP